MIISDKFSVTISGVQLPAQCVWGDASTGLILVTAPLKQGAPAMNTLSAPDGELIVRFLPSVSFKINLQFSFKVRRLSSLLRPVFAAEAAESDQARVKPPFLHMEEYLLFESDSQIPETFFAVYDRGEVERSTLAAEVVDKFTAFRQTSGDRAIQIGVFKFRLLNAPLLIDPGDMGMLKEMSQLCGNHTKRFRWEALQDLKALHGQAGVDELLAQWCLDWQVCGECTTGANPVAKSAEEYKKEQAARSAGGGKGSVNRN